MKRNPWRFELVQWIVAIVLVAGSGYMLHATTSTPAIAGGGCVPPCPP
jgi:hypothetical protein